MKQKRKIRILKFNLIEIVLALGVTAVGMAGVISVISAALDTARSALQDRQMREAVSRMRSCLSVYSRINSGSNWKTEMKKLGSFVEEDKDPPTRPSKVAPTFEGNDRTIYLSDNSVSDIFLWRFEDSGLFASASSRAVFKPSAEKQEEERDKITAYIRLLSKDTIRVKYGSAAQDGKVQTMDDTIFYLIEVSKPCGPMRKFNDSLNHLDFHPFLYRVTKEE